jgi:hypothetical protein
MRRETTHPQVEKKARYYECNSGTTTIIDRQLTPAVSSNAHNISTSGTNATNHGEQHNLPFEDFHDFKRRRFCDGHEPDEG